MKSAFLALLGARVGASALSALVFILFARSAPLAQVGALGAVAGTSAVVFALADLGLANRISQTRAHAQEISLRASLRANALVSMTTALAAFSVTSGFILATGLPSALALVPLAAALEKNTDASINVAIADGKRLVPASVALVRRLILLILFLTTNLLSNDPLLAYCVALLSGDICTQMISRLYLLRHVPRRDGLAPSVRDMLREILASRAFFAANSAAQIRQVDATLVVAIAGPNVGGLYTTASRVINPFLVLPSTLSAVILPRASIMELLLAQRIARRLVCVFSLASIILGVTVWAFSPLVVEVLGPQYSGVTPTLTALAVGLPAIALSSTLGSLLQGQGEMRFVAANGIAFAIITLAAIIAATFVAGAPGAAIGAAASYALKDVILLLHLNGKGRL